MRPLAWSSVHHWLWLIRKRKKSAHKDLCFFFIFSPLQLRDHNGSLWLVGEQTKSGSLEIKQLDRLKLVSSHQYGCHALCIYTFKWFLWILFVTKACFYRFLSMRLIDCFVSCRPPLELRIEKALCDILFLILKMPTYLLHSVLAARVDVLNWFFF